MRALFVLNTPGFIRYFDTTIEGLLERGHEVLLAFQRSDLRAESLDVFADAELQPVVVGEAPERSDRFAGVAFALRACVDYLRFLDPAFADAEYLRGRRRVRAVEAVPVVRVFGQRHTLPRPFARGLVRLFLTAERAVPSDRAIEEFIERQRPDVVLVSPLVTGASPQADYVKSALSLGIPVGLCVASWDNLTNKGLMRVRPDTVFVWNEAQREEAARFHNFPRERVVVTGAQPFDRWFGRRPATTYAEFCERAGIRPDRPYAMFVGSTGNIAKADVEESFAREWIEAVRASADPLGRELGILVRPHPDRKGDWDTVDLSGLDNVTLWPPTRPNSVAPDARTEYFDSLYHAAAVVGINTSAMVEASLIERPVLTIRAPQFEQAQRGTIHFQYLLPENGGFLLVAQDLAEHVPQLLDAVRDASVANARNDLFRQSFIRPRGVDQDATTVLVEAIEELGSRPRRHGAGVPMWLRPVTGLLGLWAVLRHRRDDARPGAADRLRGREAERVRRLRARAATVGKYSHAVGTILERTAERRENRIDEQAAQLKEKHKLEAQARKRRKRETKEKAVALLQSKEDQD